MRTVTDLGDRFLMRLIAGLVLAMAARAQEHVRSAEEADPTIVRINVRPRLSAAQLYAGLEAAADQASLTTGDDAFDSISRRFSIETIRRANRPDSTFTLHFSANVDIDAVGRAYCLLPDQLESVSALRLPATAVTRTTWGQLKARTAWPYRSHPSTNKTLSVNN